MMVAVATTVHELLTESAWHARPPSGYPSQTVVTHVDASWPRRTGLNQAVEQAGVLTRLRVPLHGQPEPRRSVLHCLQRAVLRPGGGDIAGVIGHGLMVIARYDDLLPEQTGHLGALDRAHVMGAIDPRGG